MDAASQRELEQFLQLEQQKQKFQASVHQFTDRCWEKCIGMRLKCYIECRSKLERLKICSFVMCCRYRGAFSTNNLTLDFLCCASGGQEGLSEPLGRKAHEVS